MVRRPGPRRPMHGSMETSLNQNRPSGDLQLGLNEPKGVSGLLIWAVGFSLDGADTSSSSVPSAETDHRRHHGRRLGRAQAPTMVHEMKQGFFLRDLGYERNSFCKLTVVKTDHGKLITFLRDNVDMFS
jgi:hypothetical protein